MSVDCVAARCDLWWQQRDHVVLVVLVGERGEKLLLVISAPSEEEECQLSMDRIAQDSLGFLEMFRDTLPGQPIGTNW